MSNRIDCYNLGKCSESHWVVRYPVSKGTVPHCGIPYDWLKWTMDLSIEVYHSPFYPDFHIIWHFRSVDWMLLMSGAWISVFLCEPLGLLVAAVYIPVWQNRFWSSWWHFLGILIYESSVTFENKIWYCIWLHLKVGFFSSNCWNDDVLNSSNASRYSCRQTMSLEEGKFKT